MKFSNVKFDVVSVKQFPRKSGSTGQEVLVSSGGVYPAVVPALDKEIIDLTGVTGELVCTCELTYNTFQCVSDSGKKYYKRVATFKIIG